MDASPAAAPCGRATVDGMALCAEHLKVLRQGMGKICAWPGCAQTMPYRAVCQYHDKRARGLLGPAR